jgi:hypothetical protein
MSLERRLELIYEIVDKCADDEDFRQMNEYMWFKSDMFDSLAHTIEEMVMLLSVTLPYKEHLKDRDEIYNMIESEIINRNGTVADGLLTGLE